MKKILLLVMLAGCFSGHAQAQNPAKVTGPGTIKWADKGATYILISAGDKLPRLFVNNKEIPQAQLDSYSKVIEKLQQQLWGQEKIEAQAADSENQQRVNNIADEIVSEKIISSAAALFSFRLDGSGFMVNGKKQPFNIYTQFKNKFITSADKVYRFNN